MTMRRFRRQRRGPATTTESRAREARLEALVREQHDDRRRRMLERIGDDAERGGAAVEWMTAVSTLRDRLIIGEDETCFLARLLAESLLFAGDNPDPELS